ncbi:MAG TPA: FKBP-type peptidyl-prolyl cis-trans isomerase [Mycobacteriales bacterium]|nr:FKBP-type peptidyl-prolyl cis-trans isomerase [Mycobacteriales bacterium]
MRRLLVSVAAVALVVTGCTQSVNPTASTPSPVPVFTSPIPPPSTPPATIAPVSCAIKVSADTAHKPAITFPPTSCPAPAVLQSRDIVVGTGPPIKFRQTAVVQYVGLVFSSHKQFDASWDRHQLSSVPNIGQSSAIDGWNDGVPGMRAGGRRLLVIPPDLAYGSGGSGANADNTGTVVGPNQTVVFVIDLVRIDP